VRADDPAYGTLENPIRLDDLWNGKEYMIQIDSGVEAYYVFETPPAEEIADTKGYFCLRVKPTDEYFESIHYFIPEDNFYWYKDYLWPIYYTYAYIGTKEEMADRDKEKWLLDTSGWRMNAVAYEPSTTYYLWFCGDEEQWDMDLRFWLDFPGEDSDDPIEDRVPATPVRLSEVVNASIHDYYDDVLTKGRVDELQEDSTHHDRDNFQFAAEADGNYTFEVGNTGDLVDLKILLYEISGSTMNVQNSFLVKKGSTVKNIFELKKGHTYYLEVSVETSYLPTHEEEDYDRGIGLDDIYKWDERDCLTDQTYWFSIKRHNYELKNEVAPTAIKLGYSDYVCKDCGEEYRAYEAPTGPLRLTCKGYSLYKVKVSWNFVKTAAGYEVQCSTDTGKKWDPRVYEVEDPTKTVFTFGFLKSGSPYKFRVRYWVEAPNGRRYYAPWSATLTAPTRPMYPFGLTLTAGKKSFKAEWREEVKSTGYQLEYALTSKFTKTKRVTVKGTNTLNATVKKLTSGKVYYVRIRTYKTVKGTNYFSSWTSARKVKVK
jgi:hypothetical protein